MEYPEYELAKATSKTVVIEVSGGVADVAFCPDGIDVIIVDYDNDSTAEWTLNPDGTVTVTGEDDDVSEH